MFKNHLRFSVRNLTRSKGYTTVNTAGLALALAACFFIVLFVVDELRYDRFHAKADSVYRVATDLQLPDSSIPSAATPRPLLSVISSEIPEIVRSTRLSAERTERVLVKTEQTEDVETGFLFADPNVFDVFTAEFIIGNPGTALQNPHTVVLTEAMALKYFGDEDPIGKTLAVRLRGDGTVFDYAVTGVVKKWPYQSHVQFDFLASYQQHPFATNDDGSEREDWIGSDVYTYIELASGAIISSVESRINVVSQRRLAPQLEALLGISFEQFLSSGSRFRFFLQPLTNIHLQSNLDKELGSNGSATQIIFFILIGSLILILATINFINLSTARIVRRSTEFGIRRALGSPASELARLYLTESTLQVAMASGIAIILVRSGISAFNTFSGKQLFTAALFQGPVLIVIASLIFGVGLAAGLVPAIMQFRDRTLSGVGMNWMTGSHNVTMARSTGRNLLVAFQFTITTILIITTVIMFNQMSHMRSQELGFNQERVAIVDGAHVLRGETEAFKRTLLAKPGIRDAAHAESVPGRALGLSPIIVAGEQSSASQPFARMYVGFDYVETLDMTVVEGRSLSQSYGTDSLAALLNQSAVSELQINNPIGKTIERQDNGLRYTVVGIVKDFNISSLHREIGPVVLFGPDPEYSNRPRQIFVVRLEAEQFTEGIDSIRETWAGFVPDQPVQISFLDEEFDAQYRAEDKLGFLFRLFSLIAMIVAGLGILGLSAYMAELRTHEIGIRKTLGATSQNIVGLLSFEFLKPVVLALVIAVPVSYLLMTQWLEQYAYRIELAPTLFIVVSMVVLLGSIVSVSIQTLRAALSNPVDALKN